MIIIMIIGIALFPPAILAYISQDALPGDLRYPVKRLVENGVMTIASINPNTKAMFSVSQSNSRLKEMLAVAAKGEDTQSLIDEIIKQNEETVAEISRVSDVNRRQELIKEFQKNSKETQTKLAKAYQTQSASTAKANNTSNTKQSTSTTTVNVVAKVECVVNGVSVGLFESPYCEIYKKLAEANKKNDEAPALYNVGGQNTVPTSNSPQQNTDQLNQASTTGSGETNTASVANTNPSSPPSSRPEDIPRGEGIVTVASIPTPPSSVIPYSSPGTDIGVASIPTPPGSSNLTATPTQPTPNPSSDSPIRQTLNLSAATIWFPQPNDTTLEVTCNSDVISVQMSGSSSNSVRFGRYKEYPATADPTFNTRNAIGDDSQGTGGYLLDSSFPIQVGVPVTIDLTENNRSTIATYWVERGTVNSSGNYVIDRYVDFRCP